MKWLKKIWEWIKGMVKSQSFDNMLFAKGINDYVRPEMKAKMEDFTTMSVDKFFDKVILTMVEKFGDIKPVYNIMDKIIDFAHDKTIDLKTFAKASVNKKVDMVCDKMIAWYDANL